MVHLRGALWGAWCVAVLAGFGCSHDYHSLNSGSGGSTTGSAGGSSGAAGVTGVGGVFGLGGGGGAIGPGGQPGSGGAGGAGAGGAGGTVVGAGGTVTGAGGAVGAGGTIGPGGHPGTGGAGGAGAIGAGGAVGSGGQTGAGGSGTCQTTTLTFTSPPSSVLILTDRGGSSFDPPPTGMTIPTTGSFFNVRAAVEDTIAGLQGQFRFGLGVFVGDHTSGACQLNYATAPIALNNAAAIGVVYDGLGPLSGKADTPASAAITMAQAALLADGVGSKFLLFITSGATDFCDDGAAACPNDVVVSQLQTMYAASPSIETLVVGLSTTSTGLVPGTVATFANAGAGQPTAVAAPASENTPSGVYYQCMGVSPWATLFAASKKTAPTALGTYAAANGSAPLFMAATNATADVETQVKAALAVMKSCSFQLTAHSINASKVAEGTVTVGGANVVQDASNGWSMPSSTVVSLNGAACASYRLSGTVSINFPCDAIVP